MWPGSGSPVRPASPLSRSGRTTVLALVLSLAFLTLSSARAAEPPRPIDVGKRKQLFVDDFCIAEQTGITRVLGTVTKANEGRPIFTGGWFYGTVLHEDKVAGTLRVPSAERESTDAGHFRMWYRRPDSRGFAYAESKDGLAFETRADVQGINFAGDYTLAVEIDPHETDPRRRHIAAYDAPGMAAGIAHSADGIHWTPANGGRPVTGRAADTYNQVLWDPLAKTYRLFTRTDFGTAGGLAELRGTRSMTNPDLKADPTRWKTVREWIFEKEGKAEAARRQVYAATCWIYEGVYFALLSVYEHPGDVSEGKTTDRVRRHERDVMNFYIATSRDGDAWDLHWVYAGRPLIPRGPDGAFDKDLLFPASTIVSHADKHWLYYAGANERHGTEAVRFDRQSAIGLAWLRLDGFASLSAGDAPGRVTTRPFRLDGDALAVNVDAAAGEIAVEILDAQGTPLPGFSGPDAARGTGTDALRWQPRWKDHPDLSPLKGQTLQFRFLLRRAKLYSFQVL